MGLRDLVDKAHGLSGTAAEAVGNFLAEFNEAVPTMQAAGFTVRDVTVGVGILPEVGAKLVGAVDSINITKLNELAKKHEEKKTLVAILNALQTAWNIKDQLSQLHFKGIEIAVKLGLTPNIGVAFLSAAPAAAGTQTATAATST